AALFLLPLVLGTGGLLLWLLDSGSVALPVSAVGLVNVSQQGALITEGLVAVDALQGALWVALCDVPLELFWNIKALLTTAAFTGFFQLPFISSREA
uniref:Uncharacterized protein n=1 Tax=Stegastes partitus TaxID=144197 RepID=A0A3B5BN64_9TELE